MCIHVQIHMAQPGIKQEITRKLQWSKTDGNYKRPNCKQRHALLSWVMWRVTEVKWMTVFYAHLRGNLSSTCPKGERNLLQPHSKIPGIKVYAYTCICPYIIPACKFSHTEAFTHNCTHMDVWVYMSICKCVCLRKFHCTRSESHRYWARQRQRWSREPVFTYCVPHHNVHICAEGIINVLSNIKIDEITEVVIHVNT